MTPFLDYDLVTVNVLSTPLASDRFPAAGGRRRPCRVSAKKRLLGSCEASDAGRRLRSLQLQLQLPLAAARAFLVPTTVIACGVELWSPVAATDGNHRQIASAAEAVPPRERRRKQPARRRKQRSISLRSGGRPTCRRTTSSSWRSTTISSSLNSVERRPGRLLTKRRARKQPARQGVTERSHLRRRARSADSPR